MYIFRKIFRFFDKLEDHVRDFLSHYPIVYAFFGGVFLVILWRGIWHTADILMLQGGIWGVIFYEPITVAWTTAGLLLSGLFVSFFIGDRIFLSGLKHEKKLSDKTVSEIAVEESELTTALYHIEIIERSLAELRAKIDRIQK